MLRWLQDQEETQTKWVITLKARGAFSCYVHFWVCRNLLEKQKKVKTKATYLINARVLFLFYCFCLFYPLSGISRVRGRLC